MCVTFKPTDVLTHTDIVKLAKIL